MIRMAVRRLFLVPLAALVPFAALATMDFRDIAYLDVRVRQVLESEPNDAEIKWFNEATGNSGMIRVLRTYWPEPGRPCRDYERTTRRPGAAEIVVKGTGCREPRVPGNLGPVAAQGKRGHVGSNHDRAVIRRPVRG